MDIYKQKYEQALENIKKIKAANKDNKELVDFIEYKYPELKESEDEKIRKEILSYIKSSGAVTNPNWIAWLEKQREQKPAWSEVDENLLNHSLENLTELKNRFGEKYGKVGECIYWLKLLKQRMKGE